MMEEQSWSAVYTLVFYLLITGYCTKCETDVEYLYSKYGESVTLKCLNSSNATTWIGPITNELNQSLYAADGIIAEHLPNAGNLELTGNFSIGEFNLRIISFTEKEDGLYKCHALQNNQAIELRFYLTIKEPPTNLLINEGMNIITGKAGTNMNIKCTVSTGVPKHETEINMYRNGKIIKNDRAEMLSYTFKPQINNDKDHFTCVVENPLLDLPLKKSAVLNITYQPTITFDNSKQNFTVQEGARFAITCLSDSNPTTTSILWQTPNDEQIKPCFQQRTNLTSLCITNISRHNNGKYTCSARNQIGMTTKSIFLTVLYPPEITIKFQSSLNTLNCEPKGKPDEYQFYPWEHQSADYGDHIRFLKNVSEISVSSEGISRSHNYEMNGKYICTAGNGIADTSGEVKISSNILIQIKGKPFFVSQNEQRQYGIIGSHLDISVYVYSYPKYTEAFAIFNGENISLKNKDIMEYTSPVWTYIKGVKVRLAGYKIIMSRNQLQPNHLTNYSFLVINEIGQQEFDVEVVSVSSQMQNDVTDEAIIISVITTALIAFGVIVFLIKDKMRKRRQKTIMTISSDLDNDNGVTSNIYSIPERLNLVNTTSDSIECEVKVLDQMAVQIHNDINTSNLAREGFADAGSSAQVHIRVGKSDNQMELCNEIVNLQDNNVLNYVEIDFTPAFVVHGKENMTIYSDILLPTTRTSAL